MSKNVDRPTTLVDAWRAGYRLLSPLYNNKLQAIPGSLSEAELPWTVTTKYSLHQLEAAGMIFYLQMTRHGERNAITVEVPADLAILMWGAMCSSEDALRNEFRELLKMNPSS